MKDFIDGEHYLDVCFTKLQSPDKRYNKIEFEECRFTDCDFSAAKFHNCKFVNCKFERCNLGLIDLSGTRLFGVAFVESKLIGVDWTKATWSPCHHDFELKLQRCILNDASFFGLTLNELVVDECKLLDVDFREGNFSRSAMTCCDFTHSLFMRTNLQGVDFSGSSGYVINVLENHVKGARFSRQEALGLLACLDIDLVD